MPAPSVIVTFTDSDGDEFPVRVWATLELHPQSEIDKAARTILDGFIAADEMRPSLPVSITEREQL